MKFPKKFILNVVSCTYCWQYNCMKNKFVYLPMVVKRRMCTTKYPLAQLYSCTYELGNGPVRCRQIYWIGRAYMSYAYRYASCVREINTDCTFNVVLSIIIITRKNVYQSKLYIFSQYMISTMHVYTRTTGCFGKK